MKNCEYYRQLICRLPDDELTETETAELLAHIDACPDCARFAAAMTAASDALRRDMAAQPPASLAAGVMDRVRLAEAEQKPAAVKKPVPFRPWFAQLAAACFVLVVAAAAVTGVFSKKSQTVDTAEAVQARSLDMTPEAAPAKAAEPVPEAETEAVPDTAEAPAPLAEAPAEDAADALPEDTAEDAALARSLPEEEAENGIMTVMEPPALADGAAAVPVSDGQGQPAGAIADTDALQALLTGEPQPGPVPAASYTLTLNGTDYHLAADGTGQLLWWRDGDSTPTLSPASFDQLEALIG